jgi:hypothetical protein
MGWSRFDDQYSNHPKVLAAGHDGRDFNANVIKWCNAHVTDGVIAKDAISGLAVLFNPPSRTPVDELVATLVRVGLWEEHPTGYKIHDFLDYNFSRQQIEKARKKTKVRVRRFRRKRNALRNGNVTGAETAPQHPGNASPHPHPHPHIKKKKHFSSRTQRSVSTDVDLHTDPEKEISTPARALIDLWNKEAPNLPSVVAYSAERLKKAQARLRAYSMVQLGTAIRRLSASELTGQHWLTFDWFVRNDTNPGRVLEGHYDKLWPQNSGRMGKHTAGNLQAVERFVGKGDQE